MADDANDFDLSNYDVVAKQGKQVAPPDVLGNQKSAQQNFLAVLAQALGLTDAARAFRGEMTPGEAETFALGSVPALLGGPEAKAAEEAAPAAARAIRAFHGSPYDFDKFDISKIGTGEGVQAYGHGLYFAENPSVAAEYKKAFDSEPNLFVDDKFVGQVGKLKNDPVANAAWLIAKNGNDINAARAAVQAGMDRHKAGSFGYTPDAGKRILQTLDSLQGKKVESRPPGKTYEVSINADPEHFLDWDKPLSEQSPKVQTALKGIVKDVNRSPADWIKSSPGAEQRLAESGIPGIKYLDQGSRLSKADVYQVPKGWPYKEDDLGKWVVPGQTKLYDTKEEALAQVADKPTHNYVVFDDKTIEILKKYGLAGLLAGGAGGAASQQEITKGR